MYEHLSRRTILTSTLAAGLVAGARIPGAEAVSYCDYSNAVSKSTMGPADAGFKPCLGTVGNDPLAQNRYGSPTSVSFNSSFYAKVNAWANLFSDWTGLLVGSEVNWWGSYGCYGHCASSKQSWHHTGEAFDLSGLELNSGSFMDANWSWRNSAPLQHKRKYVGTAMHLRRSFDTVLTYGWQTPGGGFDHQNHFHFDAGQTLSPIDPASRADTCIVQMACKHLGGSSIGVTGEWDVDTEHAYLHLKDVSGMSGLNPRGDVDHMRYFFQELSASAWRNEPAGG